MCRIPSYEEQLKTYGGCARCGAALTANHKCSDIYAEEVIKLAIDANNRPANPNHIYGGVINV